MPTASGTFSAFGNNFLGTFRCPLGTVKVTGKLSRSVPRIIVSSASVTYDDPSQFSGIYDIIVKVPPSFVGTTTIDLVFLKDAANIVLHVTGSLDYVLPDRLSVAGFSTWTLIGA
ncbi:hypothetical protein AX14_008192 [Amanita brunnescens Koide BX004]|nr:hypothetical protein AX14_011247 [Amanita brunnescens Koide BX004]KAF8725356.1 hypothetical protein AX14_008192 [Amanita brunnescens Koide BX004]